MTLPNGAAADGPVLASHGGKARVGVVDRTITPTLDKERQAQASREADAWAEAWVLFERITMLEKPAWYAAERASGPNGEGWMEYVGQGGKRS